VSLEARAWVYSGSGPASKLQASPQARQFMTRIVGEFGGDNVFIVTARPDSSSDMTSKWLASNGLDVCPVVFADDKVEVALRLGITHSIEDSARHATAYQAAGVTAFFLHDGRGPVPQGIDYPVIDLLDA